MMQVPPLWVTSDSGIPSPPAISPPNAAYIDDPAVVSDKRLDSAPFTYTGPAQLTFRHNFALEIDLATRTAADCGVLEISNPNINGGAFTDIIEAGGSFVFGGYNNTKISPGFENPCLPSRPNWTGTTLQSFLETTVNLPAAGIDAPSVLRWRMCSDNSTSGFGWRVDNVTVDGGYVCCTPPRIITVTFGTDPANLSYTLDGITYTSNQMFSWLAGSHHTISTTSPQSNGHGVRYAWTGWSDNGAISHAIFPTTSTAYTARFTISQYFLRMRACPFGGGLVFPGSGWINKGADVIISAGPRDDFRFWVGSGDGSFSGRANPTSITMNGPITEIAHFLDCPFP